MCPKRRGARGWTGSERLLRQLYLHGREVKCFRACPELTYGSPKDNEALEACNPPAGGVKGRRRLVFFTLGLRLVGHPLPNILTFFLSFISRVNKIKARTHPYLFGSGTQGKVV